MGEYSNGTGALIAKWGDEIFDDGVTNAPQCFMRHGRDFVTPAQFSLICNVLSYQYGSDSPFPSIKTIAENLGVNERAIRKLLQQLADSGLVEVYEQFLDTGYQTSNQYSFQPLLMKCLKRSQEIKEKRRLEKGLPKISVKKRVKNPTITGGVLEGHPHNEGGVPEGQPLQNNNPIEESHNEGGVPEGHPYNEGAVHQGQGKGVQEGQPNKEVLRKSLKEEEEEEKLSLSVDEKLIKICKQALLDDEGIRIFFEHAKVKKYDLSSFTLDDLQTAIQKVQLDMKKENQPIFSYEKYLAGKLNIVLTSKKVKVPKKQGQSKKPTSRKDQIPEWLQDDYEPKELTEEEKKKAAESQKRINAYKEKCRKEEEEENQMKVEKFKAKYK